MPVAQIKVIEGVFSDAEKKAIVKKVTDALVSIEGENTREKTVVLIEEIKSGDWGVGGQILTTESVKKLRSDK
jgi:4-oxalocrotonate tautomerase